jgi:uncharacterized protein (DUF2249 family)
VISGVRWCRAPIIAAGGEPFNDIMAAVAALGRDEELVVLAPFDPVPLEGVLGSQGFACDATDLGDGDWRVTFRRPPWAAPSPPTRAPGTREMRHVVLMKLIDKIMTCLAFLLAPPAWLPPPACLPRR